MSKMGQLVYECQTIAEEAYLGRDLEEMVEQQFSDRPELRSYAEKTAKQIFEDIPFE